MNMPQILAFLKAKRGPAVLGRQPGPVTSKMKGSLALKVIRKNGDVENLGKVADLY